MEENVTERKRELEKLKIKDETILIRYRVTGGEGRYPETITLEGTEPPLEALKAALQGMAEHAVRMMEAPAHWAEELTVLSVTVTHHDVDGLVITSLRKLDNSDAPLVLNTPHFTFGARDDFQELGIASTECIETLDQLAALAFDYVDGERKQRVLEFETRAEPDLILTR